MKVLSDGLVEHISKQGILDYERDCQKCFDAIMELVAAGKAALDDLFSARVHNTAAENKRNAADAREEAKRAS